MNFQNVVKSFKCHKHKKPVQYLCFDLNCKDPLEMCNDCNKEHIDHIKSIMFVKDIELYLNTHSNANKLISDPIGLQTLHLFQSYRKKIETKLADLELELRQIILGLVDDQKYRELGEKFLKEAVDFQKADLILLKQTLLQMTAIQNNKLIKPQDQNEQKLQKLKAQLDQSLKQIEQQTMATLECLNIQYYYNTSLIKRLQKVWIDDNGSAKPAVHMFNTLRSYNVRIKDKPIYLAGIHQPILYKGQHEGTSYDSQKNPHTLIYSIYDKNDLKKPIFELIKIIEHQKMQIVEERLYEIFFDAPIKLFENKEYVFRITTNEQKPFQTYHYSIMANQNEFVEFQTEDENLNPEDYPSLIKQYYSQAQYDQLPGLIVKHL
ncbi:hypothetical protein pb186bvf_011621 [Paramecium bursaria]